MIFIGFEPAKTGRFRKQARRVLLRSDAKIANIKKRGKSAGNMRKLARQAGKLLKNSCTITTSYALKKIGISDKETKDEIHRLMQKIVVKPPNYNELRKQLFDFIRDKKSDPYEFEDALTEATAKFAMENGRLKYKK